MVDQVYFNLPKNSFTSVVLPMGMSKQFTLLVYRKPKKRMRPQKFGSLLGGVNSYQPAKYEIQ